MNKNNSNERIFINFMRFLFLGIFTLSSFQLTKLFELNTEYLKLIVF